MCASKNPAEIEMLCEQVENLRCAVTAVILLLVIIVAMILVEMLDFSSSYALLSSFNSVMLFLMMTVPLFFAAVSFLISKREPKNQSVVYDKQEDDRE
jgi:amino acid transporter